MSPKEGVLERPETEFDLSYTGPGTLGGRFMRQFWLPVCRAGDLAPGTTRPIRIMNEDYTLFRGKSGNPAVVDARCPHRGTALHLGNVEDDALRCFYHGWKFDSSGQCIEQPAEGPDYARRVTIESHPTREFLGLIFAYFGEGEPPAFPPYPEPVGEGIRENMRTQLIPCNWLQSYENTADETHVAFVHLQGGQHSGMYELPEISVEETPWGMLRHGRRAQGKLRVSLHYMPNVVRIWAPMFGGLDKEFGWKEYFFFFTPVDDHNHLWLFANHVPLTGEKGEAYLRAREEYYRDVDRHPSVSEIAEEIVAGKRRLSDVRHPDVVFIQDIVAQAGQGRLVDRNRERLGRGDKAILLWRRMLMREMQALAQGTPTKRWQKPPADVLPTLGF